MKKIIILAMAVVLSLSFATLGFSLKKDVEFKGGDAGKVVFSHETHTEKNKLKCNDCHTKLFPMKKSAEGTYTMAAMNEGKNCGSCHDGKKAFSVKDADKCGNCHKK
jgi:c(7)-type cytochrome triheme protein